MYSSGHGLLATSASPGVMNIFFTFLGVCHENVPPEPPASAPAELPTPATSDRNDVPETYVIKYTIENTLNYDVKFSVRFYFDPSNDGSQIFLT